MTADWEKEIYRFQGTAREERVLRALLPENIRMDARELHHWLAFLARSARLIQYYNDKNEPSGNWAPFLEKDPSVFLSLLMDNRPETWDLEVRELLKCYYGALTEADKIGACGDLFVKIARMAGYLDSWYANSLELSKWGPESPATTVLKRAIRADLDGSAESGQPAHFDLDLKSTVEADLSHKVMLLWDLADSLQHHLPDAVIRQVNELLSTFHPIWNLQYRAKSYPFKIDEKSRQLDEAVDVLRQIFQRLHFNMVYLAEKLPAWFRASLDQKDDHDPFTALLLAFLQIFTHVRDQLNTYPKQHLDHYYLDLLRQQPKVHVPDRTTVCFLLADHVSTCRLEKGTLLLADVNAEGLESHYATVQDLLVTQTRIASLKTVYKSKAHILRIGSYEPSVASIYAAPVANSRDGQGAPFLDNNRYWPLFGEEQWDKSPDERRMTDARIGFVIAAPILALREGSREIDVQFQFTPTSFLKFKGLLDHIVKGTTPKNASLAQQIFSDALLWHGSGEKGWFQLKFWRLLPPDPAAPNTLAFRLHLSEEDPALVDNNPDTLEEAFDTPWPLLKVVLNPEDNVYVYDFLKELELETVRIETRVKGLKSLTLLNELGLIDATAPFYPFGPMPNRSAYLLIGNAELFRKRLNALSFHIEWNNLPDLRGGFAEYYREYGYKVDNSTFQVGLSALSGNTFKPLPATQQTFSLFAAGPDSALEADREIKDVAVERLQIQPNYTQRDLQEYSNHARSGYLKLQLAQPPFAFGHADYPLLFSKAMIAQTKTGGLFGRSAKEVPLPREPYVPIINRLNIGYSAATTLNMRPLESGKNDVDAQEKVFSLHPFGHQEIFAHGKPTELNLLPQLEADGYMHIGLEVAEPAKPLSLFFNIQERPLPGLELLAARNKPVLQWYYLRANRWEALSHDAVVSDTTDQFTTKGIVKIVLPAEIDTQNTVMPAGLFWLCVSITGSLDSIGEVSEIHLNAVEASWIDNGDLSHFDANKPLPPVRELVRPRPEIAALTQPVGFEGGSPDEQSEAFYVRVSERLRHKNRAINRWDMEHLVLGHFPFVREVKCVTPQEYPSMPFGETTEGAVRIVVIPQAPESELEPMVGYRQLAKIQDFLISKASPFATIQVINPEYEKIKVTCSIRLKEGLDVEKGLYLQVLHEDLLYFICPWLRGGIVAPGSDISTNEVLDFIKRRPYIRFVTRFSLVKISRTLEKAVDTPEVFFELADTALPNAEGVLRAETPWSVFVPVAQHSIDFAANEQSVLSEKTAIEGMRLGTDFIILEGMETPPPSNPTEVDTLETSPAQPSTETETEWFLVPK